MRKTILVLMLAGLNGLAQVPNLLKDLSPGSSSSYLPGLYARPNNDILFAVGNNTLGSGGLWVSDGSTAGTIRLNRVIPTVSTFFEHNNKTYFTTSTGNYQLWSTNGTVAGTDSIASPPGLTGWGTPMAIGSNSFVFTVAANKLWTSDLTTAGTFSIAGGATGMTILKVVNNIAYFRATTATEGTELWRTDGTAAGTYILKDIWAGAGSSFTNNPIVGVSGNNVYFIANNGSSGAELWRTDGTTSGTILLGDIYPGTASSGITSAKFWVGNNGVYFTANNQVNGAEMWFSDGTVANTHLIADVAAGAASASPSRPPFFNGNHAYYWYVSGVIYKTDGSTTGTSTLNAVAQYTAPAYSTLMAVIFDSGFHLYNNELYFAVYKSSSGISLNNDSIILNKVDLNLNAKTIVGKQIYNTQSGPTINSAAISNCSQIGTHFLYLYTSTAQGMCLLVFNVATNQHKVFYGLGSGSSSPVYASGVNLYNQIGNRLYFPFMPNDTEPGYLDLSTDSLHILKSINSAGPYYQCLPAGALGPQWEGMMFPLNNKLYFLAKEQGYGLEFFETDLTPSGTFRLKDIYPGANNFDNGNQFNDCSTGYFLIKATANNIYFGADDGNSGFELWSLYNTPNNPPPPPPPPPPPTTTTSINETASTSYIGIFPNPATNRIIVEAAQDITAISIYDAIGAQVQTFEVKESSSRHIDLNINGLTKGIYFVNIKTRNQTVTKRLIID